MKKIFSYILLPVLLIGIFLVAHSKEVQALEIQAELLPQQLQVGGYGQLKITVTGARKAEIQLPDVDGLTMQPRGSMQSMQIINGDTTISYTANYLVVPQHQGQFTIEPITATVKGETVTAAPLQFEVADTGSSAGGSKTLTTEDAQSDNAPSFLQFIPQKKRLYVGEKVPFQLKAYFRHNATELTLPVLSGDGFIVAPFSKNPQQQQEVYKGQTYTVLTWNNSLSGVKSGSFSLQFSLSGTLLLQQQQQARDPFGNMDPFGSDFFNDFFSRSRYQQVPVELKSDSTDITVVPLPIDHQPADFSGAVGQFSLSASATPVKVSPGEPVTLKLIVTGNGNFDRVQCPNFPDTVNFKVYQADESGEPDQQGKAFERAVVPKDASANTIPAHTLTYFDPVKEQYVTTSSRPIPLLLQGSDGSEVTTAPTVVNNTAPEKTEQQNVEPAQPAIPLLLDNLAPQKLDSGSFSRAIKPVHKQLWFLTVLLLLSLCLACLIIIGLKRQAALRNPERLLKKHQQQQKLQHLQAISDACMAAEATGIMKSCRAALQHQIGLLTGISSSAVTAASLTQQSHVDKSLLHLLEIAEEYFYGGILNNYPNAAEYAAVVKKELENIA